MKFPSKLVETVMTEPFRILRLETVATVFFVVLGLPLWAQTAHGPDPSAHEQSPADQKSHRKATRVWTDDDIASVRTPADIYKDQEGSAARKSAEISATKSQNNGSAAHDSSGQQAADMSSLPNNADAVESLIQQTTEEINRKQGVLDKASADVTTAGNDLARSELKSNEEIAKADLDSSKDEMKLLQARLAQLKSKTPPEPIPNREQQGAP